MSNNIRLIDWQSIDYAVALEQQEEIFNRQILNKQQNLPTENMLIFCSHPHVYTIGKSGNLGNMLLDDGSVPVIRTNRGGDITYHGQGQIVGYPIFDLESFGIGLKDYIHKIETAIIRTLAMYNIDSERLKGATGVWLDTAHPAKCRKICAIGVRSSRFVTMHGFALNVNTDLSYFAKINPCGFIDKGVTSMQAELGWEIKERNVKNLLFDEIKEEFLTK